MLENIRQINTIINEFEKIEFSNIMLGFGIMFLLLSIVSLVCFLILLSIKHKQQVINKKYIKDGFIGIFIILFCGISSILSSSIVYIFSNPQEEICSQYFNYRNYTNVETIIEKDNDTSDIICIKKRDNNIVDNITLSDIKKQLSEK